MLFVLQRRRGKLLQQERLFVRDARRTDNAKAFPPALNFSTTAFSARAQLTSSNFPFTRNMAASAAVPDGD